MIPILGWTATRLSVDDNGSQRLMPVFPTAYADILKLINSLDLSDYTRTRNHLQGTVSRLSPYLTHGVIGLSQLRQLVRARHRPDQLGKFEDELLWREFFQRVWQARGDDIFTDLREAQLTAERSGVPRSLVEARTGIDAIDAAVQGLYDRGYVHNHARMWIAAITCHQGRCHWPAASRWFYWHLLDGDLASNTLSWQWVAGTFSSKPYVANQENLNAFSGTQQSGTFLDVRYEQLLERPIPTSLADVCTPELITSLPAGDEVVVTGQQPLLLYHPWNLDPLWRAGETAQRVLVLEPDHFARFPMSPKRMEFLLALARNIPDLQIFVGNMADLPSLSSARPVCSREYPATAHWPGERDLRDWLFPGTSGYFRSYSAFKQACR